MSFGSRLTHTVSIVRKADAGTFDDYNLPITDDEVIETIKAAIQPRTERASQAEQPSVSQGGVALSELTIFMFPTDLRTADAIVHDQDVCPLTNDLPSGRYEILAVPNAAGLGHHLEARARLVESAQEAEGS
jgi:hypothetical protein